MDRLDERIAAVALNPFGCTEKQYETVCLLTDEKRRVVNMQVLAHRLLCGITEEERALAGLCLKGDSYAEIAAVLGVSKATAYRKVRILMRKAAAVLVDLGFTEERLRVDYADIRLVRRTYRHICQRQRQRDVGSDKGIGGKAYERNADGVTAFA